jgi:hypothetical protein
MFLSGLSRKIMRLILLARRQQKPDQLLKAHQGTN